eukprot:CAMPEP_0118682092 /NCGR_PEP_ID=MMETSP0800-20121206/5302_1 /TAXON_ID=210618 ORGANISM="Striatella unipunctata, Strain CCMP2910" /NCGR_SAMPLE_ID=MMETSP0800 /ASSEMBLY_ACC=CAM_ASM_000638 /LENGTH=542 /DNA_ID=CAMNT_0006578461 /DNA_START=1488 /DNA_END=3116 /DNA_ORIENTATION=+
MMNYTLGFLEALVFIGVWCYLCFRVVFWLINTILNLLIVVVFRSKTTTTTTTSVAEQKKEQASLFSCIGWINSSKNNNSKNSNKNSKNKNTNTNNNVQFTMLVWLIAYAVVPILDTSKSGAGSAGLQDLFQGTDPRLEEILRRAPIIKKGPSPPLFMTNGHVQFVPWLIQNEIHKGGIPFERIDMNVTGCIYKLPNCTHSPLMTDTISLDIFPSLDYDNNNDDNNNIKFNRSSPVILLAPGLRCYSQDLPGNTFIRLAYSKGFRSIVVNRRGHTPNRKLKAPRWNLLGDFFDMDQVYWHVKTELLQNNDAPMFLWGISSGSAVVIAGLSEWDRRYEKEGDTTAPRFVAAAAVSPGYDTRRVFSPERFRYPYNQILNPLVKDHFVLQNEELLRRFDSSAVDRMLAASNLQELVDASAPFAGYHNATSYYDRENPVNDLLSITTPTFVLNAADDPCCRIGNLYETSSSSPATYGTMTYADVTRASKRGLVAVTRYGSHCPFLDGGLFSPLTRDPWNGGYMLNSWSDRATIEFFEAALYVYSERR